MVHVESLTLLLMAHAQDGLAPSSLEVSAATGAVSCGVLVQAQLRDTGNGSAARSLASCWLKLSCAQTEQEILKLLDRRFPGGCGRLVEAGREKGRRRSGAHESAIHVSIQSISAGHRAKPEKGLRNGFVKTRVLYI